MRELRFRAAVLCFGGLIVSPYAWILWTRGGYGLAVVWAVVCLVLVVLGGLKLWKR